MTFLDSNQYQDLCPYLSVWEKGECTKASMHIVYLLASSIETIVKYIFYNMISIFVNYETSLKIPPEKSVAQLLDSLLSLSLSDVVNG